MQEMTTNPKPMNKKKEAQDMLAIKKLKFQTNKQAYLPAQKQITPY